MPSTDNLSRSAKRELDARIVDVELTLIAIIQAVPLVVLADKAAEPVLHIDWQALPYLAVGLLTVLLFWSRALIHTLSFIAWPLDFTHNFLYIVSTLVQAILMTQISNPSKWYALWIAYTLILWITYSVDLRVIRKQIKVERGINDQLLLNDVLKDQILNVRFYMPAALLFSIAALFAVSHYQAVFIEGKWHLVLAGMQLLVGLLYLWEGYAILRRRNDRILQRQMEADE